MTIVSIPRGEGKRNGERLGQGYFYALYFNCVYLHTVYPHPKGKRYFYLYKNYWEA